MNAAQRALLGWVEDNASGVVAAFEGMADLLERKLSEVSNDSVKTALQDGAKSWRKEAERFDALYEKLGDSE